MSERDNEELAKLKLNLAKDRRQQERKGAQIENIRIQLERVARDSVAKYHREVDATRPEAQETIDRVIQPWFSDLVSSGSYAELLRWCRSHENDIRLSDTIMYYWPEDALKALAEDSNRPYADTASFVAEDYKRHNIQQGIQVHADGDEVWYTGFKLYSHKWDKSEGVRIFRQPVVGMGFGYAMKARSYDVPVDVQNVAASLDRISPEVWIKFGQQVESGKVWEMIDQSMRPRKVIIYSPEETQRRREDDSGKAAEYLKARQWR